ncbi:MAG: SDR family NAD(P)-dependent oxidoreductase [Verrucomicrobia bacterium]|nr:SDR family NAD(P)-dependent oxidoreductase [Verrucomicrobiota bacterium]
MGHQLFQHEPVFRRELEKCAEIVKPLLEIPLLDLLFTGSSEPGDKTRTFRLLDQTQYTQPALFALEYAIAAMWRSWGLEPAAVLGHSVGEYVAACVAGVFNLEDGLKLITERGRLMAALPYGGAMAAVFADESTVAKAIEAENDRVVIACVNGPASVVVSGESVIVDALLSRLNESGIRSRSLQVSHAFHSPMMDPILAAFRDEAAKIQYSEPSIAIASNVTGTIACRGLMINPEYWRKHVRHPVRFADSVRALREKGLSVFLEIGPHPVLNQMARMTVPETDVVWADSLNREQGDWESLLQAVSTLYVHGVDFDWTSLQGAARRKPVALPTYAFQRGRYWLERKNFDQARLQRGANRDNKRSHPLLGKRLDSPAITGTVFESETGMERPGFLNDHRVFGRLIMPSPVFIEMALAGAAAVSNLPGSETLPCEITDMMIREPLLLPEQGFRIVQLILDESSGQGTPFRICSRTDSTRPGNPWQTHATGHARVCATRRQPETNRFEEIQARCCEERDVGSFYESLFRLGLQFGERFRGVARIWRRDGEALGKIKLAESLVDETGSYRIHPALLDSCFHLLGAALPAGLDQNAYLLIGLERITFFGPAAEQLWNHTVLHPVSSSKPEALSGDMWLYDQKNRLVAEIISLQLRRVTGEAMTAALGSRSESWFYDLKWREQAIISANREKMDADLAVGLMPAPELLADSARSELRALAASENLSIYEAFVPKLEALSTCFVNQAMNRLGWSPQLGETFTTRELADRLAVVSTQRRLFNRLLGILAEDGMLKSEGDRWRVLKPLQAQAPDLPQRAEALKQQFPACSAEVTLTARCGDRLSEALCGTCDPLQLLFPGGDFDLANALYRTAPFARALNGALRHLIVRALQDSPKDRMANILEIGAGTGGTTSFLFPHLPAQRIHYAFTDVSPVFLTKARDEFRDYPFAGFEFLDIEKPPGSQGFSGRKFDVIIAANVFHATRDLAQTLRNAAGLLADDGLLVLLEATARRRWVDLTFGLTEGWWRFEDSALRRDCALLPAAAWRTLFEETGLEASEVTAAPSDGDDILGQAILIGRKRTGAGRPIREAEAPHGFWIVFSDTKGIAEQVTALISKHGEECLSVSKAAAFEFAGTQHAALDPLWPEGFTRLFSSALVRRAGPLRGVLNLWPVDEDIGERTTPSEWEAAQARLGGAVLHTSQAFLGLQSENISPDARLWFATCGAQSVSVEGGSGVRSSQPVQALAWGLARTISLEHPGRFGAVIDLDPGASPGESAAAVWHEIVQADGEDAVAYRNRTRLLPRIVPAKELQRQELTLSRTSSYLITGGLGGLGLRLARWMAARGAGHVILLSRRNFPDRSHWPALTSESPHFEAAQCILNAEKLGTKFTIAQGDVANEVAMRTLLQQLAKGNAPLRGIVHAAVEMTSQSIFSLDLPSFQEMCRAKALGAWVLHQITSDTELDFLVFFSSTTALWGVAGLAHYAAANQALDILAHWRREHGLPALSVNWGTWQEMRVAKEADKKRFEQAGLLPMPDAQALATLEDLLQTDRPPAVVASVNWEALRGVYEARRSRPIFFEMQSRPRTEIGTTTSKKSEGAGSFLRRRLENTSLVNRREIIRAHLCSLAGEVLGFDLSREIDLDQGLFDMGMDSLMAVELKGRLERSLGVQLPSTLTFNFPTINALTDYLIGDALRSAPQCHGEDPPQRTAAGTVLSMETRSEDLSEEEITNLLLKKLEHMK